MRECSRHLWLEGFGVATRAMAAHACVALGADIRPQLATLLGKEAKDIGDIRKTGEIPPRDFRRSGALQRLGSRPYNK